MDSMDLYIKVLRKGVDHGEISVDYIKQNYPIGLNKAIRIMDWMTENGYIERVKGHSKPSKVTLTLEKFNRLYGDKT